MSLRLFCAAQNFRSHARAAQAYIDVFASLPPSLVTRVDDPDEADVAYLHMEPEEIAKMMHQVPSLKKAYCIGFCVWEANDLPGPMVQAIAPVDEVWTASWYNWATFAKAHPKVRWIPHIVSPPAPAAPQEIADMRAALGLLDDAFVYVFIGEDVPRKNIRGLIASFLYVHSRRPQARLVIKSRSADHNVSIIHAGPVIYCSGDLTEAQVAALYGVCDTYVSAHFSEGWGLTLSDAMARGKLCVATHYSGNTDFMTRANSLPVRYSVDHVKQEHCVYLFDTTMKWGYPHPESLEHLMLE